MTAPEKHPLSDGYPPSWAHAWGQDRYGIWVEVEVGSVRQRLRWIPGGVFWMGSPVNEDWRYDTDWPIHQVSLRTGFWLADSPCTQEFWCQLSAKNPSEFVSAERPVERIS
ncbi:MAG: formylglycine-generating enzyme family protein, partial [Acidobacteriota bacterium]